MALRIANAQATKGVFELGAVAAYSGSTSNTAQKYGTDGLIPINYINYINHTNSYTWTNYNRLETVTFCILH